jgi:hypothetical protein
MYMWCQEQSERAGDNLTSQSTRLGTSERARRSRSLLVIVMCCGARGLRNAVAGGVARAHACAWTGSGGGGAPSRRPRTRWWRRRGMWEGKQTPKQSGHSRCHRGDRFFFSPDSSLLGRGGHGSLLYMCRSVRPEPSGPSPPHISSASPRLSCFELTSRAEFDASHPMRRSWKAHGSASPGMA